MKKMISVDGSLMQLFYYPFHSEWLLQFSGDRNDNHKPNHF